MTLMQQPFSNLDSLVQGAQSFDQSQPQSSTVAAPSITQISPIPQPFTAPQQAQSQINQGQQNINDESVKQLQGYGDPTDDDLKIISGLKSRGYDRNYIINFLNITKGLGTPTDEELQTIQKAKDDGQDPLQMMQQLSTARNQPAISPHPLTDQLMQFSKQNTPDWIENTPVVSNIYNAAQGAESQVLGGAEEFVRGGAQQEMQKLGNQFGANPGDVQGVERSFGLQGTNTSNQNTLEQGEGALNAGFAFAAPIMTAILQLGSTTQVGRDLESTAMTALQGAGSLADKLPILNKIKASLPQEDQQRMDSLVGQAIALGLGEGAAKAIKIANMGDFSDVTSPEKKIIQSNPYVGDEFTNQLQQKDIGLQTPKEVANDRIRSTTEDLVSQIDQKIQQKQDIGPAYEALKQNPKVADFGNVQDQATKALIKIGATIGADGKINFDDTNIGSKTDMNKIQQAYDRIQSHGSDTTAARSLNLRQALDDMKNYEAGSTSKSDNVIGQLREAVDTNAKSNFEGLKGADELYSKQINELKSMKKGLVDNKGNVLQGAYTKVGNAGSLANTDFASKLDEYFPGTNDKIEAVKQAAKLMDKYNSPIKLNRIQRGGVIALQAGIAGAIGHFFGAGYGLAAGLTEFLIDRTVLNKLGGIKQSQITKIIGDMSPSAMDKLQTINQKITSRQEIDAKDKQALQDIINNIQKSVGLEKTKVDTNKIVKQIQNGLPNYQQPADITSTSIGNVRRGQIIEGNKTVSNAFR